MTSNEKVYYKTVIECVKVTNIFIGLKKTCLGVLDRGDRDKNNETDLKEGGVIEMSTTVLHSRAALSLEYLRPHLLLFPYFLPRLHWPIRFPRMQTSTK